MEGQAAYGMDNRHGAYGEPLTAAAIAIIGAVTAAVGAVSTLVGGAQDKARMAEAQELQVAAAKEAEKQSREAIRLSAMQGYYTAAATTGQLALASQVAQMEAAESAQKSANVGLVVMGALGLASVWAIFSGGKRNVR